MIGGAQNIRVVLHHQNGVAQVAQLFKNVDQPRRVARMQADRGLVEHVERADQPRTQRSRQLNPLRLAAAERRGQAVERQVFEPDGDQKAQPLPHFFQNRSGDLLLHRRQASARRKIPLPARSSTPSPGKCFCRPQSRFRAAPHALRPSAVVRGNPGTPRSRDTCSASRAHAACISCAPSAQRIP